MRDIQRTNDNKVIAEVAAGAPGHIAAELVTADLNLTGGAGAADAGNHLKSDTITGEAVAAFGKADILDGVVIAIQVLSAEKAEIRGSTVSLRDIVHFN